MTTVTVTMKAIKDTGNYPGTAVKELTIVGIFEFQHVFTSHH